MFCPECGTQNPDQAAFCENCGTKLEVVASPAPNAQATQQAPQQPNQAQYIPPAPKAPRKPMPLGAKIAIILVVVLIAAGTGGYLVLKNLTNPKNIVTTYAKAYTNHDAKALFNCLGFEESPFITVDKFKTALETKKDMHFNDATDYSIEESESNDTKNSSLNYQITFSDSSNAFEYDTDLVLTKKNSKSYLFFNNWKIKTDSFLSKDCAITVPVGAKVTVDGIELNDKYKTDSTSNEGEESIDTYVIHYLFAGEHKVNLSLTNFKDYEETFEVNASDYEKHAVFSISSDSLELAEEVGNTLIETSKTTIKAFYDAALAKKGIEDVLSEDNAETSDIYTTLTNSYNSYVDSNIKGDTHLKSVEFSTLDGTATKTYNYNDDHLSVYVTLDTKYTSKSVVKSFWNNKKTNKTYDGESSFTFTYHYVDGTWKLYDTTIFDYGIYYSRY